MYIRILFFHLDSFIFAQWKLILCYSHRVLCLFLYLIPQHQTPSVTFSFVSFMWSYAFGYVILHRFYLDRLSLLSLLLWRWVHNFCAIDNRDSSKSRRDSKHNWQQRYVTLIIGFRVPRRYFPFFYAIVTLMIRGSVVCALFAIGCGVLYLYLTRVRCAWLLVWQDNSKTKAIFVNVLHRLYLNLWKMSFRQHHLGYSDVTMMNREELRMKMKERYTEQLVLLLYYSNTN